MIDLSTTNRRALRVDEVVELLGRPRRTIYNWVNKGRLKLAEDNDHDYIMVDIDSVRRVLAEITPPAVRMTRANWHTQQA